MRITAELLNLVEQRTNPLGERELVLSGLGIPAIENMGAARDEYDCYNISNNRLIRLENFPKLHRLTNLIISGNRIESIDMKNITKNLPNLISLSLGNNNITSLLEMQSIGKACPKLEWLDLTGNPVTRRQHYRLYAIHHNPALKYLDFARVKPAERDKATRLAQSAAGAALENDLQKTAAVKTFTPGESEDGVVVNTFTADEKAAIRELLTNASSVQEIEEIENSVRKGILPQQLKQYGSSGEPDAKRQKV